MKHLKKLIPLMLALVMILTLAPAAYGTMEGTIDGGSITITNPTAKQTYSAYQILYIESYNVNTGVYSYKANTDWKPFVESPAIKDVYLVTDAQGYVTWKENANVAAFAKLAAAEMAKHEADATATADENATPVTISGLKLGYYLVDTTMGSICALNTTKPNVNVTEKNTAPTIEKQVKEGETWGPSNTAQIGDTVEFKITVHAKPGAVNYVVHDTMTKGLTFNEDIKIAGLTKDKDYTVHVVSRNDAPKDECTFEVRFTKAYLDAIAQDTEIVITYSAVLDEDAVIANGTNDNTAKLVYGDNSNLETTPATTNTYTYEFDLVKTDSNDKLLDGAEFELYDASTGGNKIEVVKVQDGVYRVASAYEILQGYAVIIETKDGKVTVQGLDSENYWLEETKAPDGYNKLASRQEVEINGANLNATVEEGTWTAGGVHVVNKAGTVLPETGGLGTTLLTTFGSLLVVGAGILLATKRRASMME